MSQFVALDVIDQLVDGAADVRRLLAESRSRCESEDATLGLAMEAVDALIADIWNGEIVETGRQVSVTPRLDALRDQGLRYLSDPGQRQTLVEAHAGITGNLSDAAELVGYGLVYIAGRYEAGDCLRELLRTSTAPNIDEVEVTLDRLESLAERRQALTSASRVLPWLAGGAAVVGIIWFLRRR